eukprot:gene2342-2656_t
MVSILPIATEHRNYGAFMALVFIQTLCYSAGYGIIPAIITDLFGSRNIAVVHGVAMTAISTAVIGGGNATGYLATITSAAENMAVNGALPIANYPQYLISGYAGTGSGPYYFNSGPENGLLVNYTNWAQGQPDNHGTLQYLGVIGPGYSLGTAGQMVTLYYDDYNDYPFVCEIDAVWAPPAITSATPVPGTGGTIVITGSFPLFPISAISVTIGEMSCRVSSSTPTSIVCEFIPSNPVTASMSMVVTINGETNPIPFGYQFGLPTVTNVSRYDQSMIMIIGTFISGTVSYGNLTNLRIYNGGIYNDPMFNLEYEYTPSNDPLFVTVNANGLTSSPYKFIPCPDSCGSQGLCTRYAGVCTCNPGFYLPACSPQQAPVITGITGNRDIGGDGGVLTISGSNFYQDFFPKAMFANIPCGNVVFINSTIDLFTCVLLPQNGPFNNTMPVTVTFGNMTNSTPYMFTFRPPSVSLYGWTSYRVPIFMEMRASYLSPNRTTVSFGNQILNLKSNFSGFEFPATTLPANNSTREITFIFSSNGVKSSIAWSYIAAYCVDLLCSSRGQCNTLIGVCECDAGFVSDDCSMPVVEMKSPLPFVQITFNNQLELSMIDMVFGRTINQGIVGIIGADELPLIQTIDDVSVNNTITISTGMFDWTGLNTKTAYEISFYYMYDPTLCPDQLINVTAINYYNSPTPVLLNSTDPLVVMVRQHTANANMDVYSFTFQAFYQENIYVQFITPIGPCHPHNISVPCVDSQCSSHGQCNTLVGVCECDAGFVSDDCSMPVVEMKSPLPFVQITFNNQQELSMIDMVFGRTINQGIVGIIGAAELPLIQTIDDVSVNNTITLQTGMFSWTGLNTKSAYDLSFYYMYDPTLCPDQLINVTAINYYNSPPPVLLNSTDPLVVMVRQHTANANMDVYSFTFEAFYRESIDIQFITPICHPHFSSSPLYRASPLFTIAFILILSLVF